MSHDTHCTIFHYSPLLTLCLCRTHTQGHLASKCPSNTGHGIYPNGGSCKLCSSVEHLAKDCPLRQSSSTAATNATLTYSTANHAKRSHHDSSSRRQSNTNANDGGGGGADDDDFHDFARKRRQVDVEEEGERAGRERQERKASREAGRGAAVQRAAKQVPQSRKVVTF